MPTPNRDHWAEWMLHRRFGGDPEQQKAMLAQLYPVRDTVLFPHAVLPLTVGRESSVNLINSLGEEKTIIVVAQREARVDAPQPTGEPQVAQSCRSQVDGLRRPRALSRCAVRLLKCERLPHGV